MVEKGQILKVKTKTNRDVFGTCWWEVVETGLPAPEKARREAGKMDGVRCVLVGGTGPSARAGFPVLDSQERIAANVKDGNTEVLPAGSLPASFKKAAPARSRTASGNALDGQMKRPGSGCVEL